eukprot:3150910-Rhodomonas_salina.1
MIYKWTQPSATFEYYQHVPIPGAIDVAYVSTDNGHLLVFTSHFSFEDYAATRRMCFLYGACPLFWYYTSCPRVYYMLSSTDTAYGATLSAYAGARRSESNSVVLQWNTTSALFEQIQMLPSVVPSFPCPVLIYLSRYVNQYRYALIVASYAGPHPVHSLCDVRYYHRPCYALSGTDMDYAATKGGTGTPVRVQDTPGRYVPTRRNITTLVLNARYETPRWLYARLHRSSEPPERRTRS